MKRFLFLSATAAGLLFCACSKDEAAELQQQAPAGKTERLYVSDEATEAAADPQSRAKFDGNGYHIAWEAGDQVATQPEEAYDMQQDETGRWYVELPSADSYTVYYPASRRADRAGMQLMQLTYEQKYYAGTFDKNAFPVRAVAQRGEKLVFKYMCSMVKLTLRGASSEQVKSIRLDAIGGEIISYIGEIAEDETGVGYLVPVSNQSYLNLSKPFVNLTATTPVALTSEGVDFYLTMLPTTFSKGFKITVTLDDGRVMEKTGGVGQTAARGKILTMPALTFAETGPVSPVFYSTDNVAWKAWKYEGGGNAGNPALS